MSVHIGKGKNRLSVAIEQRWVVRHAHTLPFLLIFMLRLVILLEEPSICIAD